MFNTSFTQFSPKITSNSFNFVHHMLVYLCELDAADIETQGICFSGDVGGSVNECTSSQLIAAWAVGGEVRTKYLFCWAIYV